MPAFDESVVDEAALAWLESVGWQIRNGAELAPGEPAAERDYYGQVVLVQRLRDALWRLNPTLPAESLNDAFRKLTWPEGADVIVRNRALHRRLVDGVPLQYRDADGSIRGAQARAMDFEYPANNDWLVFADRMEACVGTLGAGREWFEPRRAVAGTSRATTGPPGLQECCQ